MKRIVYAFKSKEGYLSDIEKYTDDPEKAVTFMDLETAITRLASVKDKLKHNCCVIELKLDFPRKTATRLYVEL
jgi:hypothetical protein